MAFFKKYKTPIGLKILSTMLFLVIVFVTYYDESFFEDYVARNNFHFSLWSALEKYDMTWVGCLIHLSAVVGIFLTWCNQAVGTFICACLQAGGVICSMVLLVKKATYILGGLGYHSSFPMPEIDTEDAFLVEASFILLLLFCMIGIFTTKRRESFREPSENSSVGPKDENKSENLDAVSEIRKFKELLDSGAITEDEYEAKKKQLLEIKK